MGIYVDRVKEGLSTLKDNKELEQEFLEEYNTRKSLIEATFENDALGRNVLKAINEDLIKTTDENIKLIDAIIANESAIINAAEQKEIYEAELARKRALEAKKLGPVPVDNSPIDSGSPNVGFKKDNFAIRSMQ